MTGPLLHLSTAPEYVTKPEKHEDKEVLGAGPAPKRQDLQTC